MRCSITEAFATYAVGKNLFASIPTLLISPLKRWLGILTNVPSCVCELRRMVLPNEASRAIEVDILVEKGEESLVSTGIKLERWFRIKHQLSHQIQKPDSFSFPSFARIMT